MNIDHSVRNEQYGHFNEVDITKSSIAEVVYELISTVSRKQLTESVATALLTGIIGKTHSFKTDHVNPATLSISSELMHLGANREHIVKHLYQNRSVSLLKLWGFALSKLSFDQKLKLVQIPFSEQDLSERQATIEDLEELIDDVVTNLPDARYIALLAEYADGTERGVKVVLKHTKKESILSLLPGLTAIDMEGYCATQQYAGLSVQDVSEKIRAAIAARLTP